MIFTLPFSLKAPRTRPGAAAPSGEQKPREGGDRDGYRRGNVVRALLIISGEEKKAGAEGDFKAGFVSDCRFSYSLGSKEATLPPAAAAPPPPHKL